MRMRLSHGVARLSDMATHLTSDQSVGLEYRILAPEVASLIVRGCAEGVKSFKKKPEIVQWSEGGLGLFNCINESLFRALQGVDDMSFAVRYRQRRLIISGKGFAKYEITVKSVDEIITNTFRIKSKSGPALEQLSLMSASLGEVEEEPRVPGGGILAYKLSQDADGETWIKVWLFPRFRIGPDGFTIVTDGVFDLGKLPVTRQRGRRKQVGETPIL